MASQTIHQKPSSRASLQNNYNNLKLLIKIYTSCRSDNSCNYPTIQASLTMLIQSTKMCYYEAFSGEREEKYRKNSMIGPTKFL